jgi:hypothetical protein
MIMALLSAAVLLAEATPAAQPPARAKPEVICRSEAEFGTRLTRKVCRSTADMRDRKASDRELADRWQDPKSTSDYQAGAIWTPMRSSTLMSPVIPGPAPAPAARGAQ